MIDGLGEGGSWSIRGRAAEMHGSQNPPTKSASWYDDDPLFSAKAGINMGHIFKIFLNWRENRPHFIFHHASI